MKILYVTDLHGMKWKYRRTFYIAQVNNIDIIINGGDMLPYISQNLTGDFIQKFLDPYFNKVNDSGIIYLSILGNDDSYIYEQPFNEVCDKYSNIYNIAQRKVKTLNNYEFIGMNWVVDYPFRLKDRCRMDTNDYVFQKQYGTGLLSTDNGFEELDDWVDYAQTLPTIGDELKKLVQPDDMKKCIYVMHMPPYRLGLDRCSDGRGVGSKAIYDFLNIYQPLISLHGHIHESPDYTGHSWARLNKTVCIQPGQPFKHLSYVIIDLNKMYATKHIEKIF